MASDNLHDKNDKNGGLQWGLYVTYSLDPAGMLKVLLRIPEFIFFWSYKNCDDFIAKQTYTTCLTSLMLGRELAELIVYFVKRKS